jgi:hypothetical protein
MDATDSVSYSYLMETEPASDILRFSKVEEWRLTVYLGQVDGSEW